MGVDRLDAVVQDVQVDAREQRDEHALAGGGEPPVVSMVTGKHGHSKHVIVSMVMVSMVIVSMSWSR